MASRTWFFTALALAFGAFLLTARASLTEPSFTAAAFETPRSSGRTSPAPAGSWSVFDPEAERLNVRRQLYESVDALVQAGEFQKARQLLDEDAERYGVDVAPAWRDQGESYRLIAECLEHPSAELRARAESFVTVSHAAGLEARVASACAPGSRVVRR
jgi:hypothetical protein